ncbi:leucine-rich repeat-containing protein 58-like [Mytilus edulis]|uniref:leucine-rich repeat-containing protein 58-like n=1 Tax=Mytilus edulis TaxID=6550 RepID=UPI0039F00445
MAEYLSETTSCSENEYLSDGAEDLSYGDLTAIPEYLFDRSKSIRALCLHHNNIEVLPKSINVFANLITLDISNNNCHKLDDAVVYLKQLRTLIAKNNNLECKTIPKDFSKLRSLEVLNFSANSFTELPPQFTELPRLKALYLGGNAISSITSLIRHMSRLEILYMGGNRLTDIPAEIGQLYNLTSLVLCDNQLQSLPPTLVNLHRLKSLSLHNNKLSTLPSEIVALNLIELSLRNNPLVVKFVQDLTYEVPSLLELSARVVKIEKVKYDQEDLPKNLLNYLDSCRRCVNPECKGVYFASRVENVKFVDFCGKYRLPLLQYLCSPQCRTSPYVTNSDTDTDDEDTARAKLKKVLLG